MDFLTSLVHKEEPTLWEEIVHTCLQSRDVIVPYAVALYWYIFVFLLITATVGRKLKLRRFYIRVLDKLFYMAAAKMEEKIIKEKIKRKMSSIEIDEDEDLDESTSRTAGDQLTSKLKQNTSQNKNEKYSPIIMNNITENQINNDKKKSAFGISQDPESLESSWEELDIINENKPKLRNEQKELQTKGGTLGQVSDSVKLQMRELQQDNRTTYSTTRTSSSQIHDQGTADVSLTSSTECGRASIPESPCSGEIRRFLLEAPMVFAAEGMRAILDDCVNSSFSPEQLKTWNLLSRFVNIKINEDSHAILHF